MKTKLLLLAVPLVALGATTSCVEDVAPLQVVGVFPVTADCTAATGGTPLARGRINKAFAYGYNLAFSVTNILDVPEPQTVGGEPVTNAGFANTITLSEVEVTGLLEEPLIFPAFVPVAPGERGTVVLRLLDAAQVSELAEGNFDARVVVKGTTGGGAEVESSEILFPIEVVSESPVGCSRPPQQGTCDPNGQNGVLTCAPPPPVAPAP